jgi:diacylglycerol kinase (ATP)
MQTEKFSIRKRAKSFQFAFDGIYQFFVTQHNAIVHAVASLLVIVLAILVKIPATQCLFLLFSMGLVWMAELFNTAIEKLCDMVCPQQHPHIKFIKDVAAAAVLVTALVAVITACIIFIPVFI